MVDSGRSPTLSLLSIGADIRRSLLGITGSGKSCLFCIVCTIQSIAYRAPAPPVDPQLVPQNCRTQNGTQALEGGRAACISKLHLVAEDYPPSIAAPPNPYQTGGHGIGRRCASGRRGE